MMLYRLRVMRDLPDLGFNAGDLLGYDPADVGQEYAICRVINPDPRAVLAAFDDGALYPLDELPASWTTGKRGQPREARVLPFSRIRPTLTRSDP